VNTVELQIKTKRPRIEIIPMIDVIFFLLVFFMLYGTLDTNKTAVKVDLPKTVNLGDPTTPSLVVSIHEDGGVWIGNDSIADDQLSTVIRERVKKDPNLLVVLHPERLVPYERLIAVMDRLAAGGVTRPLLGVERQKQSEAKL
jgi:biopolymer transport protein ExbD